MPDNVSLTVAEINQMKQTSNSLISRLKEIRFYFATNKNSAKESTKSLPIISDTEGGLVIYAAKDSLKLTKVKSNKIEFTLPAIDFSVTPVIQVTLTDSDDASKYLLNTSAKYEAGKITVWVSSGVAGNTITSAKPTIYVNVLAIGYA